MAHTNLKAGQIRWDIPRKILYIIIEAGEWCQVMVISGKNNEFLERRTWYYEDMTNDELLDDPQQQERY